MHVLDDDTVLGRIDLGAAAALIARAYAALGRGEATQSVKQVLPAAGSQGFFLSLAACVPDLGYAMAKWGSYRPGEPGTRGSSTSTILVSPAAGGAPLAVVDGMAATTLRTAASAAAIVQRLAPEASRFALVGYGQVNQAVENALVGLGMLRSGVVVTRSGRSTSAHLANVAIGRAHRHLHEVDVVISATGARQPIADLAEVGDRALVLSLDGAATWAGIEAVVSLSDHDDAARPSLARAFVDSPAAPVRFVDSAGAGVADVALCALLLGTPA